MSFQTPQTPGVIQPRIKIVGGQQDINSKGRSFRAQEAININYNQQIMSRQSWSAQEDQAITKLVKQHGIEDWTKIAHKLRDYLGKHKRTGKQCRERWYNHLSPSVCKNPWTQKEEQLLFVCHKNYGNRWKDISKMFSGRTDNDIKNHFYSTLRRSLRRLNKTVGEKNSTTQMREVKPSVLSTIMHYIYEQEQHAQTQLIQSLKDLPLLIFEFASFKPIKLNIKNTNIQQIRQKTNQIFSLIARFNEEYETNKAFRRNLKSEKLRKKQSNHDYESNERAQGEIKIQERSDSYQQEEPVVNNNAPAVNEIQQHNIKVEIKDEYFDQNIDMKPLNKTEFSLEHDQGERYNHENVTHLTIFHQFDTSPKQSLKEPFPNQPPSIRGFSLEADEINDLHFHEPQQPSRLNMDENEYVRFNHEMEGQKDRYHHAELIDEVIQTHFAA